MYKKKRRKKLVKRNIRIKKKHAYLRERETSLKVEENGVREGKT